MTDINAWVSAEFENLAQVVNDYDNHLHLEFVPFNQWDRLTDKSKVFRILDDRTNTIVLYADSLANPQDILARLWGSDATKGDVVARLDIQNKAQEALNMAKQIEEQEAAKDLAAFAIQNTKSRWKHNGIIYDDEFRNLGTGRTVID